MDINLARTFLTVAETGSFIEAARQMNITQSTVSARIKSLEEHLEKALFERSKSGAALTSAGEQFRRHALALVRVWQHARKDISGSDKHRDHLSVGAPLGLWDGFLLNWLARLRSTTPDIAVSAAALPASVVTQRMVEGTLDLAIVYRPIELTGILTEHLFDDEYTMVTSVPAGQRPSAHDHAYMQWGPDLDMEYSADSPVALHPDVSLNIGAIGIEYLLAAPASGYCPSRLVKQHIQRGRLRVPRRARKSHHPVYMAYPEMRDEEAYEPILDALRRHAAKFATR